ncbi:MAG: hypothetical protein ABI333_19135 [bacterium]
MRKKWTFLVPVAALLPILLWALLAESSAQQSVLSAGTGIQGPEVVLSLPWGGSGYALGRHDGDEAASEGPASFVVSPRGEIYVLDQLNSRVLKFADDGTLEKEIPIPAVTFEDLAVTADGVIVLLDRLVRRSLLLVNERGVILAEYSVEGYGIPEGGLITAMFMRDDGVWLEYGHTHVVHVLDSRLQPCGRSVLPGRIFERDRTSVFAATDRQGGARIWIEELATGDVVAEAEIVLAQRIERIIWIAPDWDRQLHVLLHVLELDPEEPHEVVADKVVGLRYDAELNELGTFESPYTIKVWEQFREWYVTERGVLYQLVVDNDGVTLLRWRWSW